jgi:hypothetical protein
MVSFRFVQPWSSPSNPFDSSSTNRDTHISTQERKQWTVPSRDSEHPSEPAATVPRGVSCTKSTRSELPFSRPFTRCLQVRDVWSIWPSTSYQKEWRTGRLLSALLERRRSSCDSDRRSHQFDPRFTDGSTAKRAIYPTYRAFYENHLSIWLWNGQPRGNIRPDNSEHCRALIEANGI